MTFDASAFEDLELSSQLLIEEAMRRGVKVEVLDRKDNFIRLVRGSKREYVKQATRTSVDSYIAPLIMENKRVTKQILHEAGIRVPAGNMFNDKAEALASFEQYKNKAIVVKPKSTNFGVGITLIDRLSTQATLEASLDEAFRFDSSILVEEYIAGEEYRFLVIADKVVGVLQRVAANVVGDGKHTILELVERKNRDPLRGSWYKKPLEQIRLGAVEQSYLKQQGKGIETVPALDEQVFLRKNSNISTGGDSIDYTDEMADVYKDVAISATRAVGAKICGADIIIAGSITHPDMNSLESSYSVIELNFNPAIHIHGYPYRGNNRHAERDILDLLGFCSNRPEE